MAEIETGENAEDGVSIVISVTEIDSEYWSSVELQLPAETEEIENVQFLVLLKGIDIAREKIMEVLNGMDEDNNDYQ